MTRSTIATKKPKAAIAVERSENSKVGTCHATYASMKSCPASCLHHPENGGTCYATFGLTAIHTRRLTASPNDDPGSIAEEEADAIRKLSGMLPLRIHVVGDCTTDSAARTVSSAAEECMSKHGRPA